MSVKKLTDLNFESEVLSANTTYLVDFYADWCGPCKMVSPIVDEIADERTDICVGKINVDESPSLAIKYNVVSIPTLIVFKNGEEFKRIIGFSPKEEILASL